jgi:hypothetical protein
MGFGSSNFRLFIEYGARFRKMRGAGKILFLARFFKNLFIAAKILKPIVFCEFNLLLTMINTKLNDGILNELKKKDKTRACVEIVLYHTSCIYLYPGVT